MSVPYALVPYVTFVDGLVYEGTENDSAQYAPLEILTFEMTMIRRIEDYVEKSRPISFWEIDDQLRKAERRHNEASKYCSRLKTQLYMHRSSLKSDPEISANLSMRFHKMGQQLAGYSLNMYLLLLGWNRSLQQLKELKKRDKLDGPTREALKKHLPRAEEKWKKMEEKAVRCYKDAENYWSQHGPKNSSAAAFFDEYPYYTKIDIFETQKHR